MITTVFFDLDGTLLPMDQDAMIRAYMGALGQTMARHGYEPEKLVKSVWKGTGAMTVNDGTRTNCEVFWEVFGKLYGADVRRDEPLFEDFYRREFQTVRHSCGFAPEAAQILKLLKETGVRAVLATNPLFPAIATESRIRWAGLAPEDFVHITSYENSHFCKPNPDYYREILSILKEQPENCLMVGNDVREDMVARELGMQVFLLTDCLINRDNADLTAYPRGGFPELLAFLKEVTA